MTSSCTRPALLLLLLLAPLARADDPPAADVTARSEEALAARWATVREAVEDELGAPFDPPPRFVPASRAEVTDVIVAENLAMLSGLEGLPEGEALERLLRRQAEEVAVACFGKIDLDAGHVLVVGESFRHLSQLAPELAGIAEQPFLDVILIHEAVHVWQDRRFDVRRFMGKPENEEQLRGRMCVLEGHAQVVTRRVAAALGLDAAFALLVRANTEVPSTVTDPALRQMLQLTTSMAGLQYVKGETFVAAVLEKLGREPGLERLFASPPATVAVLSRPGDYLEPAAAHAVDLRAVLKHVQAKLPEGWPAQVVAIPAAVLQSGLAAGGAEAEAWLADGFREAMAAVASDPRTPGRQVIVSVIRSSTREATAELARLEEVISRAKDEQLSQPGGMLRITNAEYADAPFDGLPARYVDKALATAQGPMVVRTLIVPRGEYVVEVLVVHHAALEVEDLQALARAALEKLP